MTLSTSERLATLLDPGSFQAVATEGPSLFVTGTGHVEGRPVLVYAVCYEPGPPCDVFENIGQAIAIFEKAGEARLPLVLLLDAPGHGHAVGGMTPVPADWARLLAHDRGVGRMYSSLARLAGEVPRVSALLGRTGASTTFPVSLCDISAMVEDSGVCIGRPDAVRAMIGETVDFDTLGGARMHCTVSGMGDALLETDREAMLWVRRLLTYLPLHRGAPLPAFAPVPAACAAGSLEEMVPSDPDRTFDIHPLLDIVVDEGSLLELKALFAREVVTALARVEGRILGLVASNSRVRGAIFFPETCLKVRQFISLCDAFGIPLVFLADTPGFMVGTAVERAGIIRAGAELFTAIARSQVPKLCIVVRKAHTAGLYAMAGPGFDPVEFLALPGASVTTYGRRALERFTAGHHPGDSTCRAAQDMLAACGEPSILRERGLIDDVVGIGNLRARIADFVAHPR